MPSYKSINCNVCNQFNNNHNISSNSNSIMKSPRLSSDQKENEISDQATADATADAVAEEDQPVATVVVNSLESANSEAPDAAVDRYAERNRKFESLFGEVVWVLMKSYPPWPAYICDPQRLPSTTHEDVLAKAAAQCDGKVKLRKHCAYFYGANNFNFPADSIVKPYLSNREEYSKKKVAKRYEKSFQLALEEADADAALEKEQRALKLFQVMDDDDSSSSSGGDVQQQREEEESSVEVKPKQQQKKRRGRPPKVVKHDDGSSIEDDTQRVNEEASSGEVKPKQQQGKRRGRPPKVVKEKELASVATAVDSAVVKKKRKQQQEKKKVAAGEETDEEEWQEKPSAAEEAAAALASSSESEDESSVASSINAKGKSQKKRKRFSKPQKKIKSSAAEEAAVALVSSSESESKSSAASSRDGSHGEKSQKKRKRLSQPRKEKTAGAGDHKQAVKRKKSSLAAADEDSDAPVEQPKRKRGRKKKIQTESAVETSNAVASSSKAKENLQNMVQSREARLQRLYNYLVDASNQNKVNLVEKVLQRFKEINLTKAEICADNGKIGKLVQRLSRSNDPKMQSIAAPLFLEWKALVKADDGKQSNPIAPATLSSNATSVNVATEAATDTAVKERVPSPASAVETISAAATSQQLPHQQQQEQDSQKERATIVLDIRRKRAIKLLEDTLPWQVLPSHLQNQQKDCNDENTDSFALYWSTKVEAAIAEAFPGLQSNYFECITRFAFYLQEHHNQLQVICEAVKKANQCVVEDFLDDGKLGNEDITIPVPSSNRSSFLQQFINQSIELVNCT